jgi:phage tail-like protein
MANQKPSGNPYSQFNFTVLIGTDSGTGPNAAFQEISGFGREVHIAEYRGGNAQFNTPVKVPGSVKVSDVTFKRGLIGNLDLSSWMDNLSNGTDDARPVVVNLLSEDRQTTAQTWTLTNARLMKYTGPSLTGKGTDVAIEEIVLSVERIDVK